MTKIINLVQGSQEWLDWRRSHITASMAAVIAGKSPWQTELGLFHEMIMGENSPPNPSMIRGAKNESIIRKFYNEKYGTKYVPVVIEHDSTSWLGASLDGYDPENEYPILEIKNPGEDNHLMAMSGHIPEYYICQMQHQMFVDGCRQMIYFSAMVENGEVTSSVKIPVKFDPDFFAPILCLEMAFFKRIIDFNPPEPCDRDVLEIIDPEACNEAKLYQTILEDIELLQAEADLIKNLLLKRCQGKKNLIGNLRLSKVIRKGNIDYSSIPELKSVDLEKYRKSPIESWRVTKP